MPSKRDEIFAAASKKLRADFESIRHLPHAGVRGTEAENVIRRFLLDHLPKRWSVGSGFILDKVGGMSPQTDLVVYDALNCPIYLAAEDAAIFPSDNVAAVVESKSTLNKKELVDAWDKIAAVRSLVKSKMPQLPYLVTQFTRGYIFAFESDTSLEALESNYRELLLRDGLGRHPDAIVVLDKGIITLASRPPGFKDWSFTFFEGFGGATAEGAHIAVARVEFGPYTLDVFLRLLLAHLMFFTDRVDHPGFDMSSLPFTPQMLLTYLTSITNEKDPVRAREVLQRYADAVAAEFEKQASAQKG